ncbi:hypothetical protein NDU88_005617 [Pleurodeles waltl]|uniref:Uncharacterized protein n=1 Tax=Pleurodeles waltl TaxID=8319 RepID=A0AAV7MZV8_PLEWA|nr:hypothetical protein NDU88_005617 [Pleurodeles waltl]
MCQHRSRILKKRPLILIKNTCVICFSTFTAYPLWFAVIGPRRGLVLEWILPPSVAPGALQCQGLQESPGARSPISGAPSVFGSFLKRRGASKEDL